MGEPQACTEVWDVRHEVIRYNDKRYDQTTGMRFDEVDLQAKSIVPRDLVRAVRGLRPEPQ